MVMAMYSVTAGQDSIQQSVGQSSVLLAQDMARFIEFGITIKIDDLVDYSKISIIQITLPTRTNQISTILMILTTNRTVPRTTMPILT